MKIKRRKKNKIRRPRSRQRTYKIILRKIGRTTFGLAHRYNSIVSNSRAFSRRPPVIYAICVYKYVWCLAL